MIGVCACGVQMLIIGNRLHILFGVLGSLSVVMDKLGSMRMVTWCLAYWGDC